MHLKYEDEQMYPYLLQHEKEEVRAISKVLKKEMGDLSAVFEGYKDKYLKRPNALVKEPSQFIKETNNILYAISKRVEKEEHELFPLLDNIR
jgi:hemerythrin-like domain-containing protein